MRLIEAIKIQAGCKDDSELLNLSYQKKVRIAGLVEQRVPSGLAPLDEWNEVLLSFGAKRPEKDCKKAKEKLLELLLK